ncbi:MAG: amino acid permease [Anaerolineae bacterium]|nr:amino acid permease [Anaerolineae bacterium]
MGEGNQLVRRLGLAQTTGIALGAMIGAGVYVSLGEAAATTGGSLVLAVVIGALVAMLNGLSSAELGATDPRAGGAYEFGREFLRPWVGFLAGWVFLLAAVAAGTTYALTFAAYLQPLMGVPVRWVGPALIFLGVLLNAAGVRVSATANLALVGFSLAVLVAFVALTLPAFRLPALQPFLAGGAVGLLQAGALLFFAYSGYARPVTVAEEVKGPRSTLPKAVVAAVAVTLALYLAVAAGGLGALGADGFGEADAPLRQAVAVTGPAFAPTLLSAGALVASVTVLLTEIWGLSRLTFAMARGGDLPGWLAHLSGEDRIPRRAVLVVGAVLLVLASVLDLRPALEASSLGLLVYYGIMNLSALQLGPGERLYPRIIPALGAVSCALLALSLPAHTILVVTATAAVGMVYYALRRW